MKTMMRIDGIIYNTIDNVCMGMYDTVDIADDAPIDDKIRTRDWQCHEANSGASYRVNSEGELESWGLSLKEGVELEEDEHPNPDQLEEEWFMMEDFNGPLYLSGKNYYWAVLMVWDGVVKETKFEKIDFEKIRENIDMPES
jgi:hypothetical protein